MQIVRLIDCLYKSHPLPPTRNMISTLGIPDIFENEFFQPLYQPPVRMIVDDLVISGMANHRLIGYSIWPE